jgi:hypothetical protein
VDQSDRKLVVFAVGANGCALLNEFVIRAAGSSDGSGDTRCAMCDCGDCGLGGAGWLGWRWVEVLRAVGVARMIANVDTVGRAKAGLPLRTKALLERTTLANVQ